MRASQHVVLLVSSQFTSCGDEELGHILIRRFFHTLGKSEDVLEEVGIIVSPYPRSRSCRCITRHWMNIRD